jgi:thiamine biosynthesis lipoprotein
MSAEAEAIEEFGCFGSRCAALVIGAGDAGSAPDAAMLCRRTLLSWHERFSRFLETSELSKLNDDPRGEVPVRTLMARFAQAVHSAGSMTGGLVDATLLADVQHAGYTGELGEPIPLRQALALAGPRHSAGSSSRADWQQVQVDLDARTVKRPPGVMLDSGGLAKGLFADVLGETLAGHASFAVNCAGDLLIGGTERMTREIRV